MKEAPSPPAPSNPPGPLISMGVVTIVTMSFKLESDLCSKEQAHVATPPNLPVVRPLVEQMSCASPPAAKR